MFDAVNNSGTRLQFAEMELFGDADEDGSGVSTVNLAPIWTSNSATTSP